MFGPPSLKRTMSYFDYLPDTIILGPEHQARAASQGVDITLWPYNQIGAGLECRGRIDSGINGGGAALEEP